MGLFFPPPTQGSTTISGVSIIASETELQNQSSGTYRVLAFSGKVGDVEYVNENVVLDWDGASVTSIRARGFSGQASRDVKGQAVTVNQALRELRAGTRKHFNIMTIGDSWAAGSFPVPHTRVQEHIGKYLDSGIYSYYDTEIADFVSQRSTAKTFQEHEGDATSLVKDDYTIGTTGSYKKFAPGEKFLFSKAQANARADRLIIPLIQEPGSGSLRIEIARGIKFKSDVSSSDWRAPTSSEIAKGASLTNGELVVDLDGTKGPQIVVLEFPSVDNTAFKVDNPSSSTARMSYSVMFEVQTEPAINVFEVAAGSNSFGDYDTAADPFLKSKIEAYKPDLVFVEAADGLPPFQNFLPKLESVYDSLSVPAPFTTVVGIPDYDFDSEVPGRLARNRYVAAFCRDSQFDHMATKELVAGREGLRDVSGWSGDNIHFTDKLWETATELWWKRRGFEREDVRPPGGLKATGRGLALNTSSGFVSAQGLMKVLSQPTVIDTGWMDWGADTAGDGSFQNLGNVYEISTGSSASSEARMRLSSNVFPQGAQGQALDTSSYNQFGLSFHFQVKSMTASGECFLGLDTLGTGNSSTPSYSSGEGIGLRVIDNGSDLVVEGIGVPDGSTSPNKTSQKTVQANQFSPFSKVGIFFEREGQLNNKATFRVNEDLIGSIVVSKIRFNSPFGFAVANGADASSVGLRVTPPRLVVPESQA